jgi:hypothetical protein
VKSRVKLGDSEGHSHLLIENGAYGMFVHVWLCVTKLRGFSQQANYMDRATAACREVSANFCEEMLSRGQSNGVPRPLISVF